MTVQIQSPGRPRIEQIRIAAAKRSEVGSTAAVETALFVGAAVVVAASAIALRVIGLNKFGYNSDEAVYAGQAAAIAQAPVLKDIFPIFRAHPLLFQFLLAIVYLFGVNDLAGRLLTVVIGLANIVLAYKIGNLLYGRWAGMIAALLLAVMPYHVTVTRQVLLDGPMTFCATLTLYFLARFARTQRPNWLYAAGAAMGLTFLAKETGIVLLGAVYIFLALSPDIRVRIKDVAISTAAMLAVIAPFPLTLVLAGGGGAKTAQNYLIWQLFRPANHEWDFYLTTVAPALGPAVLVIALLGLILLIRENTWREKLLVAWLVVPVIFFQWWPTKGFHYLIPIAVPLALLAGRTLARWPTGKNAADTSWRVGGAAFRALAVAVVALTLVIPSWQTSHADASASFLAGSGGVPGGRETGEWIRDNTPESVQLMTIGPSAANIVQFYGQRRAYGLSVSPNPLNRNPSYRPIRNPDQELRDGDFHYLVWDSFSAARSPFFAGRLMKYVEKYHARVVHITSVKVTTPEGEIVDKPAFIIYEAHP